MSLSARSVTLSSASSRDTGREAARRVMAGFEGRPAIIVVYLTVNHDQVEFLRGVREIVGDEVPVLGCSAQGVVGNGTLREEGYAAGAMALGGAGVSVSHALIENADRDGFESGRELGRALKKGHEEPLRVVVLHYDALSRINPEHLIAGLHAEVECPIVGGAAAHSFNYQSLQETYQYYGERVLTNSAVAFGLSGALGVEIDGCHGCSPVGVELTVTRAANNVLLELDGRRACEVWSEICGDITPGNNQSSALAIGVPVGGAGTDEYFVRAAYVIDPEHGSVVLGPAIAQGTRIMLHHRTVEDVRAGAERMGARLKARLDGRAVKAAFGFECGARTGPFLGTEGALEENVSLQRAIGGEVPWLGMMPWGELLPIGGRPTFHNYSFPVLVLTD